MTTPFVAFDIEIAKIFLEDNPTLDPEDFLGISCAATLTSEGELLTWHNAEMGPKMTTEEACELVEYLRACREDGLQIVTWNGMKFDFHVLAVESGMRTACALMAWEHVDIMFAIHCIKGYPLGLEAASKACGSQKGVEGLTHGRYAPYFWVNGQHQIALDYVSQDVRATAAVADTVQERWGFIWISQRGNPTRFFVPEVMRPVDGFAGLTPEHCIKWVLPDQGWMENPLTRDHFYRWLEEFEWFPRPY